MNIACPGCGTRYAIAPDKVKGRRIRIACKHCSAPIIVDGTQTDGIAVATSLPPHAASAETAPAQTATRTQDGTSEPLATQTSQDAAHQKLKSAEPLGAAAQLVPTRENSVSRGATPLAVPAAQGTTGAGRSPALTVPKGKPGRELRATIIGVAAPANPPPPAVPPAIPTESTSSPRAAANNATSEDPQPNRSRSQVTPKGHGTLKRTMIGGLAAAPGSAPTPEQAVGLGIPTETKWTVLLAGSGASVMSAADVVRAFVEGKVNRDSKLWREGLDGWKCLADIDAIVAAFERAGIPRTALVPSSEPVAARPAPALAEPADAPATGRAKQEPASARTPSAPAAASTPSTPAAAPAPQAPSAPFVAPPSSPLAPVDGSPSPTYPGTPSSPVPAASRPDIGPRDSVHGELQALSSVPPAAEAPASPERGGEPTEVSPTPDDAVTVPPKPRRRRRNRLLSFLVWLLLVIAVGATVTLSYRTRQPKALYGYLQQRHWDVPIDRSVQRFVIRPYHQTAKQLRALLAKAGRR